MRLVAIIIGVVLIVGCKNRSQSTLSTPDCKELLITTPDVSIALTEGVSVTKIFMDNGCLSVRVKFKGCEASGFDLVHNGKVMKSLPPQINLALKPLEKPCETIEELEKEFKFNIKKLQGLSEAGKVVIRVQNFSESVVYEY